MENYLIYKNSTIKQALKKLSECGGKCLIVVSKIKNFLNALKQTKQSLIRNFLKSQN